MDAEGGMDGPGFLAPIPEDVSVAAASQYDVNLSTVSAVASSDSGGMAAPHANTATKKRRGGKRRWKGDRRGKNPTRTLESTRETAAMEDNVSDANASLGGAEHGLEIFFPTSRLTEPSKVDDTSKSVFLTPNCKKLSLIFLVIVSILAIAIGIGMYIILVKVPENNGNGMASVLDDGMSLSSENTMEVSPTPTPNPKFSPFEVTYTTDTPSSPPAYSPEEIKMLDNAFLKVPGTSNENVFDKNTPQGKGRDWMINSDAGINVDKEQRVQQRYILCVLYFATNGDFWKKKFNWLNAERSECEWYGVTCNTENNITEMIDLSENNVNGTFPNEISYLSNLVALNMSYGNISGTIPEKLFDSLDELEMLDMRENQILGIIPKRATSLSQSGLRFLSLGSNELTGTFPFFPKVESISFDKNNLTSIDFRYSTASSLKVFKGFHNRLSGPLPRIWDLPELIELDLGYNFWTGTIPQDLWNLPSLKTLWLDHCNLTGPLPSYSSSNAMHRLWLDSNLLTGTIPLSFGWNWTKLYSVKLQENSFTGSISLEQCDRWNAANSNDAITEGSSRWKFDTDCQIDCACCTNADCVSSIPANVDGRL